MIYASYQTDGTGSFTTAVAEDRLFVEAGTELRCDLNFTSENTDPWLVPKGSKVMQSVPAFVWQFSGLLPVTEYLKSVTLHGYGTEVKERAWEDVQVAFYDGLRAEGARDFEAKIAFAGAYAYAPRWPEVEFIDVTVPARDKGSRVFKVKYNEPAKKKLTIDDYRALVRELLDNPDQISIEEIREMVDMAGASVAVEQRETGVMEKSDSQSMIDQDVAEFMKPVDSSVGGNTSASQGSWKLMPDGSLLLRSVGEVVR